jgi:hypothetical protein
MSISKTRRKQGGKAMSIKARRKHLNQSKSNSTTNIQHGPGAPGPSVYAGSTTATVPGVQGISWTGQLILNFPVLGSGVGVFGTSGSGIGVQGISSSSDGVFGQGKNGVHGHSPSPTDSGVWGESTGAGYGVSGSTNSATAAGVWGDNQGTGAGVKGTSAGGDGVLGSSASSQHAGVSAINTAGGYGVWAKGKTAGYFESTGGWAIQVVSTADADGINVSSKSQSHAAVSGTNTGGGAAL